MDKKYITTSAKQTQKLGENLAEEILATVPQKGAVVLALFGNLGGGKTTFLQGFAKGLGIKDKILSPTFVIQKRFEVPGFRFKDFYHIDCYRLKDEKDAAELGLKDILKDARNIIAIEWPERIKKVLPKNIIKIDFKFIDDKTRKIKFDRDF
ncbi:MAG: tRNA (adenosine(37)-N6)-threonylcarbamoyltransferase complex ATPase subunit type 1 TsaE [Candidatus Staskawiczbacteria bacterium]|nr:tRNA (adenosine(37)-N6)-threonylcarbamoyltransferase complex ATPase subunit type 1 TsaE [Candidatus Staskawiczbacteria bacterium]